MFDYSEFSVKQGDRPWWLSPSDTSAVLQGKPQSAGLQALPIKEQTKKSAGCANFPPFPGTETARMSLNLLQTLSAINVF